MLIVLIINFIALTRAMRMQIYEIFIYLPSILRVSYFMCAPL